MSPPALTTAVVVVTLVTDKLEMASAVGLEIQSAPAQEQRNKGKKKGKIQSMSNKSHVVCPAREPNGV